MSTKRIVRKLMKESKRFRNNDKLLSLAVWRDCGLYLDPEQEQIFMTMPSMVSIARRRREFEVLYPADKIVREKRDQSAREIRDHYGNFWKRFFKGKIT